MAFDQSKVGQFTADLMTTLDEQYDEDCEFGDMLLLVEVLGPHGSNLTVHASQGRSHVNLGLVKAAEHILVQQIGQ